MLFFYERSDGVLSEGFADLNLNRYEEDEVVDAINNDKGELQKQTETPQGLENELQEELQLKLKALITSLQNLNQVLRSTDI